MTPTLKRLWQALRLMLSSHRDVVADDDEWGVLPKPQEITIETVARLVC